MANKNNTIHKTPLTTSGRYIRHLTLYSVFSICMLLISPLIGSESLNYQQVIRELSTQTTWSIDTDIFINLRLPRILLGFLTGGGLALVGSVFQIILRNPLATPYTLGVTGGAATGAYFAIAFPVFAFSLGPFTSVQFFSLAGAAIVMVFIYTVARRPTGVSMNTLLLAGVTIGILCSSFILLIRYLSSPHLLVSMDRWMMGGLDVVGYRHIAAILPLLLPGLILLLMNTAALNHLSLGREMAMGHGIDVSRVQLYTFAGGSLTTAAVVSLAGPIGFIGLLIPHIIRKISGHDSRIILPGSFLTGGSFLILCDTVARTVVAPTEMPVGIITAMIGGPFFIYILLKKR